MTDRSQVLRHMQNCRHGVDCTRCLFNRSKLPEYLRGRDSKFEARQCPRRGGSHVLSLRSPSGVVLRPTARVGLNAIWTVTVGSGHDPGGRTTRSQSLMNATSDHTGRPS